MATISVSSHAAAAEMREWDAAPLRTGMPHGPAKAATYRQHGDDLGQLARRCRERAAVRGKGGLPPRPVARAEIPPVLGRSCAGGAPRFRRFRFTCGSGAYFRICKPQRVLPRLRFPCGSGVCCAARRTAGRGSSSALPAEAAFAAQRDGQRVAVLRPLSLRKWRSLRDPRQLRGDVRLAGAHGLKGLVHQLIQRPAEHLRALRDDLARTSGGELLVLVLLL